MSAVEALKAARAAGIQLGIDGDDLVLEASAPPPPGVIDLLSRHKAGIVALLRPADDGWSAEDWQVFFDERAGIVEFDGGAPRTWAEALAGSIRWTAPDLPPRGDGCASSTTADGSSMTAGRLVRSGSVGDRSTCSAATGPSRFPASITWVFFGYSMVGNCWLSPLTPRPSPR